MTGVLRRRGVQKECVFIFGSSVAKQLFDHPIHLTELEKKTRQVNLKTKPACCAHRLASYPHPRPTTLFNIPRKKLRSIVMQSSCSGHPLSPWQHGMPKVQYCNVKNMARRPKITWVVVSMRHFYGCWLLWPIKQIYVYSNNRNKRQLNNSSSELTTWRCRFGYPVCWRHLWSSHQTRSPSRWWQLCHPHR